LEASERLGTAMATALSNRKLTGCLLQSENFEKVHVHRKRDQEVIVAGSDVRLCRMQWRHVGKADIIILAISYAKQRKVAEEISQVVKQKIVISICHSSE
jgi:predicted dinucleotide-binding enzyme